LYINLSSSSAKHLFYSESVSLKRLKEDIPTMMKHLGGKGTLPGMNDV
jgi:uncharacterized protein YidB (DUF937 family)